MESRRWDRVELTLEKGEKKLYSRFEYEALALDVRVRAILNKRLRFFRGEVEVSLKDAIADR